MYTVYCTQIIIENAVQCAFCFATAATALFLYEFSVGTYEKTNLNRYIKLGTLWDDMGPPVYIFQAISVP